jgi:hypothetical protein
MANRFVIADDRMEKLAEVEIVSHPPNQPVRPLGKARNP